MKYGIHKILKKINTGYLLAAFLLVLYILFEFTNLEHSLNNAFNKLFTYILVPILACGSILVLRDSTKNIFKKEALSEGALVYVLWWIWVLLVAVFGLALLVATYKAYFE